MIYGLSCSSSAVSPPVSDHFNICYGINLVSNSARVTLVVSSVTLLTDTDLVKFYSIMCESCC